MTFEAPIPERHPNHEALQNEYTKLVQFLEANDGLELTTDERRDIGRKYTRLAVLCEALGIPNPFLREEAA